MYTREEVIDTYAEEGGARPGGDSTGRAAAIAGDILGGLDAAGPVPAAPVIDAELKQAEPTTVPEATKQTAPIPVPASAAPKQAEPAAPAEPAQGLSASDQPVPPAHPTVARKIYNKYLDFFSGDKGEAKRAMDKVTGGKPSKDWTIPTVMSLESRLAELERERAAKDMGGVAFSEAEIETLMGTVPLTPAPKPAGVGAGEIKAPMPADAKETGFPPTVEPIDADEARRIAEEEAAAFL
jgi:hypothetical protein